MKFQRLLLLSLFVVAVSSMSFATIITPLTATETMGFSASADSTCGTASSSNTQSWTGFGNVISPMIVANNVTANCTGNKSITVEGQVKGTWSNNTKNGKIIFKNVGWNANKNVTSAAANADLATDYSYTFQSNTNSTLQLTLNYLTSFTGDLSGFGLNGFYVNLSGGQWSNVPIGITDSGTLTAIIAPFQTYTLTIENGANIGGLFGKTKELLDGTFDFNFRPVPEPTSMLLMGGGILALAGALRKRMRR